MIPLDRNGVPDLPSGGDNYRLSELLTHVDPASDQLDPNPAIAAPRILWLSTVHCPVDVTKKANPCVRIEEHKQEQERATEIASID